MPTDPQLLLQLTRSLRRVPAIGPLPLRLCHAFVDTVQADGGAISLGLTAADRTLLCATDDLAARVEEAQVVLSQGPTLDAARFGQPVLLRSVAEQRERWPALVGSLPALAEQRLVHAFPMTPQVALLGVLTVHESVPRRGAWPVPEVTALADAVGAAVLASLPHEPDDLLWGERDRVSAATGMVIAQLRLSPPDALAVLRAHAFATESTLAEVSAQVLDRRVDFGRDGSGAP